MLETMEEFYYAATHRREPEVEVKADGAVRMVSQVQVGHSDIAPYLARLLQARGIIRKEPGTYDITGRTYRDGEPGGSGSS